MSIASKLDEIFVDCMFLESEVKDEDTMPDDAVVANCIMAEFGFHPGRLASHKDEIAELLKNGQERLQRELTEEERISREVERKFSELPSVSFWENPFGFLNRKFVERRAKNLKKNIVELRQKIKEYTEAPVELKKGMYDLAIRFLYEIAERFYIMERLDIPHIGIRNTRYWKTLDLRAKLIAVSEKKELPLTQPL